MGEVWGEKKRELTLKCQYDGHTLLRGDQQDSEAASTCALLRDSRNQLLHEVDRLWSLRCLTVGAKAHCQTAKVESQNMAAAGHDHRMLNTVRKGCDSWHPARDGSDY